jgi:hypothetical protein
MEKMRAETATQEKLQAEAAAAAATAAAAAASGAAAGVQGDDEGEEDDAMTDEDKRVKSELALIMMELWEPKSDEQVEKCLVRLIQLADRVRNRKLIRIAGAIPILVGMLTVADPNLPLTKCQSLSLECIALLSKNVLNR